VLFDSPPVLPLSDAAILGSLCTGVLYVIRAEHTRTELVLSGKEKLERIGLPVLGVVLTQLRSAIPGYYSNKYYTSSRDNGHHPGRSNGHIRKGEFTGEATPH
jgi:Mrp family chromosome partitioning ATPase